MRHFLSIKDFTKDELLEIITIAAQIKKEVKRSEYIDYLEGQTLGMIFEKSSTRTRVSFEVGIHQLGGKGLFLSNRDLQLGRGEPVKDTARVISRMVDMIMIRTFGHERVEEFAEYSKVPVINGLTDLYHPMQLLADYLTMVEYNKVNNPVVAYIGDGNNMAHSWLMLASKLGFTLRIATPVGYEVNEEVLALALDFAQESGAKIEIFNDPKEAVDEADVVTTDVWTSMGQEEETAVRMEAFQGYMIDRQLMSRAKDDAIVLHCLPAHRGEEIDDETFELHANVIFDEAENRLHAQKGVMVWLDKNRQS